MQRATMVVFSECNNVVNAACSATVNRQITLNSQLTTDAWGFRPLTLSARAIHTRYQGRMVSTQSRNVVQLTGFDWSAEGTNLDSYAQKREGITASLFFDGRVNVTTFCKTRNTGTYSPSGAVSLSLCFAPCFGVGVGIGFIPSPRLALHPSRARLVLTYPAFFPALVSPLLLHNRVMC